MKLCLVTACDRVYAKMAAYAALSLKWYQKHNPETMVLVRPVPASWAPKAALWFKLVALMDALATCDVALWIDADAMLMRPDDLRGLFTEHHTLYIAEDANGINCGVMAWRGGAATRGILAWLIAMEGTSHANPQWWEQGALMELLGSIDHQIMPKRVFNAYPGEIGPETRIAHFPGIPLPERLDHMRRLTAQRRSPAQVSV